MNIGSNLGWILIMIGLFLRRPDLAWLGVLVFSGGALFALATLPVEFNASARAKELLYSTGIIQTEEERRGVNQVLNAAALTYVAGLVTAVMQLLYYVFLIGGMGGRRRELSLSFEPSLRGADAVREAICPHRIPTDARSDR